MRLPKDLISGNYKKPRIFLCETNKEKICPLETTNTKASLKFNSYSELSFEVGRVYNDIITGDNRINPYYDKIESPRIIYLENIAYFEIQGPELSSDGIKESKAVTAYSLEYALSQRYLTNFLVNTGEIGSIEVTYAEAAKKDIRPITLYNPDNQELSLLHLVLRNVYGWSIGTVDASLQKLSRTFEVDRESVYDFLMNEVCEKFHCYIVFDTINNKINVYAESLTQKCTGDGVTREFTLVTPFAKLGSVSIDGYKTTQYTYAPSTGKLIFDEAPKDNAMIEVVDGALTEWETDVFVTFDNLSKEININYDADSIKTMLTVTGADDLDIREVNMGLPYLIDLSYYCSTPEWFGPDLYSAYMQYLKDYNSQQNIYADNSHEINELDEKIIYEQNRMSSDNIYIVEIQPDVTSTTAGVYFVRGGTPPNYYYTEVTLPADYNANETYYLFEGEGLNLTETDVDYLYHALQDYFKSYFNDKSLNMEKLDECSKYFSFIDNDFKILCDLLRNVNEYVTPAEVTKGNVESINDNEFIFACVNRFLNTIWSQLGSCPLEYCYKAAYTTLQTTAMEAGWGDVESDEYGNYFAVYLMLKSIERALKARNATISDLTNEMQELQKVNAEIGAGLDLHTYFKKHYPNNYEQFMLRLSAFLREDEYTDDNFVQTGRETLEELYQTKRELKECGKIELNRLCQPKLQFSMTMANIYALPEFEPIIDQFRLGNVIKVGIRNGYVKQSRLLQVDIGLDDFSDFSCEFGELTTPTTQSDLHADLLSQAISAGKQVASSASYWNKGTDQANSIDLRIQRGLLDAVTSIKSMDGTQGVEIDNYGIHLRKTDPTTGAHDPEQGWITNNKFLYSNDAFKTVKSVFGKYKIDDEEYWGLLAEAVIAGYIEGSQMVGGTINIGEGAFVVDEDGSVTMNGGNTIKGYTTENYVHEIQSNLQGQIDGINNTKMYRVEISTSDSLIIDNPDQTATLTCKIYSWDTNITDQYQSYIRWIRTSSDTDGDTAWNSQANHKGVASITIGPSDIVANASFHCEVDMPD